MPPAEARLAPAARNSFRETRPSPQETKRVYVSNRFWLLEDITFYLSVRFCCFPTPDEAMFVRRTNAGQTPPRRPVTPGPGSSRNIPHNEHALLRDRAHVRPRPAAFPLCRLTAFCFGRVAPAPAAAKSELRSQNIAQAVVAGGFACFGTNLAGVDGGGKPRTPRGTPTP